MDPFRLFVHVTPGAKHQEVVSVSRDLLGDLVLKARITALPEKGMANKALVHLMASEFKLAKSTFELCKGSKSRQKCFLVQCDLDGFLQKASALKIYREGSSA